MLQKPNVRSGATVAIVVAVSLLVAALMTTSGQLARRASAAEPRQSAPAQPAAAAKSAALPVSAPVDGAVKVAAQAAAVVNPIPELGVQYNGTWSIYTDAQRAVVLDRLKAAGAKWVRIDVSWATLQPNAADYDRVWAVPFINGVIQQARAKGFKILVTFWQAPQWANGSTNPNVPPADPNKFAAAAAWAVQQWGSVVNAWEIWNEPNSNDYFVGTDAARYTKLLCATYARIKAVQPTSTVLFGGLMYVDDAWMKKAYVAGAHGCFDVLGVHPFQGPSNGAPETADDGNPWHLTHMPALRSLMTSNGDGALPVWFTEFGWSTGEPPNSPPWHTGVTPTVQGDYLKRAVSYTRTNYPYVKNMFWFRDSDQHTDNVHEDGFGLLTQELAPKPALAALTAAATGAP